MNKRCRAASRAALASAAAALALVACDNDPSRPDARFPTAALLSDSAKLGRQGPIRFLFPGGLSAATALDPANFVVTNLCNGLRIPGAVTMSGDTLVFTPSQALPFLTRVGVRIQNLQAGNGAQLEQPITSTFVTEPPPVADASWTFLNSPTNDLVSGTDFAATDPLVGYALTRGGGLYRTSDGGRTYAAIFKVPTLSFTSGLDVFGTDSVFFSGASSTGSSSAFGVFRSVNGGRTVEAVSNLLSINTFSAQFVTRGAVVRGVVGGQSGGPRALYYRSGGANGGTLSVASGVVADPSSAVGDVALSADTTKAVLVGFSGTTGIAYRSVDGGQNYVAFALPAATPAFQGTGFVNNAVALLLGDSSTIYRADVGTGTITALGAAAGIPQNSTDPITGEVRTFSFRRARFDAAGKVGYVIGTFLRRRPGTPDQLLGVVLQSTDGGLTFTRQAIQGAPDNGLGFPAVVDVSVKASGLATLSGLNGLIAARQPNAPTQVAVCSVTQP